MDERLKRKRERGRKRVKAYETSNKINRAKRKGEKALERINKLERIIAYVDTSNMLPHIEEEVKELREEIEEETDYKGIFIEEFINKLEEELNNRDIKYIKKDGEKIYTIRDGELYKYYSTKKPIFEEIIENYEYIQVDTSLDEFVDKIKKNRESYREMYISIID